MTISRRHALQTGVAAAATVGLPYYARAQGTGWSKLKGQSIVVNWPAHPHYAVAKKLLPEFTTATGIKVELDEMPYLRLKDAQVLQMSKPKSDYDVCVYVIMWKTEYVQRKFLAELEPMFQNVELAMPDYDRGDIIKGYYEGLGFVGGPRGYLPGPGAKLYGIPYGAECSVLAYRKDIFAKHDIKVPQTYDDLVKAARLVKAKEPGMGGLTQRAQAGHQVTAGWLLHLTPQDGLVIDDKYRPAVDQPAAIKATEIYKELIDTGPTGGAAFDFGQMMNAFLQGQAGLTLDGEIVAPGDPAGQTRQALENIRELMRLAGGTLADVVKIVVYVTEREYRPAVYAIIDEFFGPQKPCSTGLVVKGLAVEEFVVEIDAYGVIDG